MGVEIIKNNLIVREPIRPVELAPGVISNNLDTTTRSRFLRRSIVSISGTIRLRDAFSVSEHVITGLTQETSLKKYSPRWRAQRRRRNRNRHDKTERVSRCLLAGHDSASCYKKSRCHLVRGSRLVFKPVKPNNKSRESSNTMTDLKVSKAQQEPIRLASRQQKLKVA